MKLFKILLIALIPLVFVSCISLQPVRITRNATLDNYTFFYVTPTETKTGSSGVEYNLGSGIVVSSPTKSTNPADIISGFFIKRGLVRLPELKNDLADKTIIINYGETGRRRVGLDGYAIEITLQIISAKTSDVICVVTGEGVGDTEADDVRIAINRCLEELYKQ